MISLIECLISVVQAEGGQGGLNESEPRAQQSVVDSLQADCGLSHRERVEPGRARRRLFAETHRLPAHTLPLRQDQTAALGRTRHHSATLPKPQVSGQFTSPAVRKVV